MAHALRFGVAYDFRNPRDSGLDNLYRMRLYSRFFAESKQEFGSAETHIPQSWIVGDVNHCVMELVAFIRTYGITDIVTWGVPPGIRPQDMTASLAAYA